MLFSVMSLIYAFKDVRAQEAIEDTTTPVKVGDATVSTNLVVNNAFIDPEHHCEGCTRMVYTPGALDEAGIAYKDDKLNLGSYQRIVFFAKGQPNEQVSFVAAGNDTKLSTTNDTDIFPKVNFSIVTENVTLKNDWQRFEIGLNDAVLSDAAYPFGIQFSADSAQKQVFYIKGVTLNEQAAQNPLDTSVDLLNNTNITSTNTLAIASLNITNNFTAQIVSNGTNYPAPATIGFEANSTGGWAPYSYSWNFGDGSDGTEVGNKVSHTFDKSGQYTVALAVQDSSIPSQNGSATILVKMSPSINETETLPMVVQNNTINDANSTTTNDANSTTTNDANSLINDIRTRLEETNSTSKPSPIEVTKVETNITTNAHQARLEERNGLSSGLQAAQVFEDANSEQASTPKAEGKKVDNLTTPGRNFTINRNNAADVNSVNKPPLAIDQRVIMYANKATSILLNGMDPDKDPVKFEIVSDPLKGVLAGFNKATGAVLYIPNPISPGPDSFAFKVIDMHNAESNVGHVYEIINPIAFDNKNAGTDVDQSHKSTNSAPVAGNQKIRTDQKKNAHIALHGMDINHDKLTFSIVDDPSHGKLIAFDVYTGKLTYRPEPNFAGQDSFTYKVTDQKGLDSNGAKVEIKVGDLKNSGFSVDNSAKAGVDGDNGSHVANRNPSVSAGPDRAVFAGTKTVVLNGIGKDPDGDVLTYSWQQIAGPSVNLKYPNSAQTSFKIQAENMVLVFELTASDGKGGQASDDVSIIIKDTVVRDQLHRDGIQVNLGNQSSEVNQ
jgi:PKD repeat protein